MDIEYDKQGKTLTLSIPQYVKKALERFGVIKAEHATNAPLRYTPSSYGRAKQQFVDIDDSHRVPAARIQRIQQIVGVFAYYARAVDPTMLMPLNRFAEVQGHDIPRAGHCSTRRHGQ